MAAKTAQTVQSVQRRGGKKSGDLGQVRDLVESVYVAIVLAFVLRAFMIEAFVIPTGSMAISLYGEHFTLRCPACGYEYAYGRTGGSDEGTATGGGYVPENAHCPNCGFRYKNAHDTQKLPVSPRGGDRVLVLKYLYDFGSPDPWDVVVFKNPQTNRENYIKRLIGLPGETIEIVGGNIFVTSPGEAQPQIRRKPPAVQEAVWQVLYDNDYPPDPAAFPGNSFGDVRDDPPWPGWQPGPRGAAWDLTAEGGRRLDYVGSDQPATLEFRPGVKGFRPFSGYNAPQQQARARDDDAICTDWKLQCVLTPHSDQPTQLAMIFESYSDRFCAEFETTGTVRLLHQQRDAAAENWTLLGEHNVGAFEMGQGRVVSLAVADYRAWISVDEAEVITTTDEQLPGRYELAVQRALLQSKAQAAFDNAEDIDAAVVRLQRTSQLSDAQLRELASLKEKLSAADARRDELQQRLIWSQRPGVKMLAVGGPVSLSHVRLMRDLYYTSPYIKMPDAGENGPQFDYVKVMTNSTGAPGGPNAWRQHDGRDLGWGTLGNPIHLRDAEDNDLDEFFCLGDNSPQSHDGRTWTAAAPSLRLYDEDGKMLYQLGTVPRYNMLGRAMLVYWPAGYDLPILGLPLVPNVGDMRLIR